MKNLFIAAALSLSALSVPVVLAPTATAQIPNRAMNDMEAIADWSAKINAYDTQYVQIANSPQLEALITVLFEGNLKETAHVGALEDQIELAKQDVSYLDIETEMDALDAYMVTLVQDRISEHGERVALMAQMQ